MIPGVRLVCVLLKYLVTSSGPFSLTNISSLHQGSLLKQDPLHSYIALYTGHPQCLIQSGHWLLSNVTFSVLPPGDSFSHSGLLTEHSLGICLGRTFYSLFDPPPLHSSRFYPTFKVQTNATSPRKPLCFLDPWSP